MGFTQEEIFRGAYEHSFVDQFGEIDPNQTWDFSPYGRLYAGSRALTRAADNNGTVYPANYEPVEGWADEASTTPNTYYEVPSELLTWMENNILAEGSHTDLINGNFSFIWQAGQVLEIIPVWQGACGQMYSLSIVMNGIEQVIWSRNDGMQVKTNQNDNWAEIATTDNAPISVRSGNTYTTYYRGCTDANTTGIRAKPVLITDDMLVSMGVENPDLQELTLKLNITKGMVYRGAGSDYSCDGDYCTSSGEIHCSKNRKTGTQSRIGLINIPDASLSVPSGYQKWLLGCEDTMHLPSDMDWDYNDVVFLIAGKVTKPIKTDDETGQVERTIEKRYMVEDLTGYADFDFNDIVVDLKETYKLTYTKKGDEITYGTTKIDRKQVATIKHLCGTVPIQVKIGEFELPKIMNPVDQEQTRKELAREKVDNAKTWWENPGEVGSGWSPEVSFDLDDFNWDPDENNLWVVVWKDKDMATSKDATCVPWTATFPAAGQVPYIIATDINLKWLSEGTDATSAWWAALNSNTNY